MKRLLWHGNEPYVLFYVQDVQPNTLIESTNGEKKLILAEKVFNGAVRDTLHLWPKISLMMPIESAILQIIVQAQHQVVIGNPRDPETFVELNLKSENLPPSFIVSGSTYRGFEIKIEVPLVIFVCAAIERLLKNPKLRIADFPEQGRNDFSKIVQDIQTEIKNTKR